MTRTHSNSKAHAGYPVASKEKGDFFSGRGDPYFQQAGFLLTPDSGDILNSCPTRGWIFPLSARPAGQTFPDEVASLKKSTGVFRILMAEDSKEQQVFVRFLLKGTAYSVDFADDGLQAIELFQEGHYDLVFMDMRMPKMDGWEAARRIREWESHRSDLRVPIIALTALSGKHEIQKCRDAGCTGYLAKPFSQKDFFKKLE